MKRLSIVLCCISLLAFALSVSAQYNLRFVASEWSPDGSLIASISQSGDFELIDAVSGSVLFSPSGRFAAVAWNPDGTRLAASKDDKSISIWDLSTLPPQLIETLTNHSTIPYLLDWSGDGRYLASSPFDNEGDLYSLRIWDTYSSFQLIAEIVGGTRYDIDWGASGNILTMSSPFDVYRYDVSQISATPAQIEAQDFINQMPVISFMDRQVLSIDWTSDNQKLLLGGIAGDIAIYDVATDTFTELPPSSFEPIPTVRWSPNEDEIAVLYADGLIELRDYPSGTVTDTYTAEPDTRTLSFSPDGTQLAFAQNGGVGIVSIVSGSEEQR